MNEPMIMQERIAGTEGPLECGHMESPHAPVTRGYGRDADGNRYCYACCLDRLRATMRETGKVTLYLTRTGATYWLGDWPGTFRLRPHYVRTGGKHNKAGSRIDVWFTWEGWQWHGVQYGENTELCHCKRLQSSLPMGPPAPH